MPTSYAYRYYIFVEIAKVNQANALAAQWDPDTGGGNTFGPVRLSPNGQEPATHVAAATQATSTMRNGITQALGSVNWASLFEDPPFTWQTACAAMGLQRIEINP